jgi:hypothetical protein
VTVCDKHSRLLWYRINYVQSSWSKGISEMKSKQQSMQYWPVVS